MLTGNRLIQITAEFVRRFAGLNGIMWVCTEPPVFDLALAQAQKVVQQGSASQKSP
jgi:phage regulator Rha-like protein